MCEPTHSITQIPPEDPDSGMPSSQILGLDRKPDSFLKRIWNGAKSWFHFSKLGRGHHEGLASSPLADKRLSRIGFAQYESLWWERKVKRDGQPVYRSIDHSMFGSVLHNEIDLGSEEAFDCAKEYANRVSIGNLSVLRKFLGGSLKCTDRLWLYVDSFRNMLNEQGKLELESKLGLAGVGLVPRWACYPEEDSRLVQPVTNILLGLTRKRKLLIPEWADDSNLWKGGSNETTELKTM